MTDWNQRYIDGSTGWDLGAPSPPLKNYIDQLADKALKILIPGAGNAYEAEHLHRQGFKNVHVIDIASTAIQNLKDRCPDFPSDQLIHGDFFAHAGDYDLILEQTFFCAIDPALRREYVAQMRALLVPGGKLVGLMFNRDFDGGPPYGGSVEEYLTLFNEHFDRVEIDECYNSISARSGSEVFISIS